MLSYKKAKFSAAYATANRLRPSNFPEFAFIGRSNVGKSSLMNAIFGSKGLVKTSSTPGKTSTINFFTVGGVNFVDLPGYAYAKRSKAERKRIGELIDGYLESDRPIDMVFLLVDIRHDAQASDKEMVSKLVDLGRDFTIIFTKTDKIAKTKVPAQMKNLCQQLEAPGDVIVLPVSSTGNVGIKDVRALIEQVLEERK